MTDYKIHVSRSIPGEAIFHLHDTKGFPFEYSAMVACEEKMVINWVGFIKCARKAGWKMKGLAERIYNACKDAGYNDEVMAEIERLGLEQHERNLVT